MQFTKIPKVNVLLLRLLKIGMKHLRNRPSRFNETGLDVEAYKVK